MESFLSFMPKVAFLHGCHQCADTFEKITMRFLTKALDKNKIAYVFLEGPYAHPDGGRTWTDPPLVVADLSTNGQNALPRKPETLAQTFDAIAKAVDGGVTHLFGFSQGAFAALEYMRERQDARVVGVVCVAGYAFVGREPAWPRSVRLLNVLHKDDDVVPPGCAFRVTGNDHYEGSREVEHTSARAHSVPSQAKWRDMFLAFFMNTK